MVLDTSALIAMLRGEPEAATFHGLLNAAQSRVSAATYLEAGIVVDGNRDPIVRRSLDELLEVAGVAIEPLTEQQARIARQAYRDFGQGSGHPARLNLGDCFSYALAKAAGEPLLFKGDNFIHTDVIPASR